MKKNFVKPAAAAGLCALLAFGGITAGAAYSQDGAQNDLRQKELVQNDRMSFFSGNEFRPAGDRMGMLCIEPGSGSFRMEINGEGGRMQFGEMNDPQQNGQMPG
ncbi:MAG: hypothetical protein IKR21_00550, partial [Oscillospiraceae bacterium]|nr:hypothetical protein [Oscillospiraceae bacterium]